MKYLFTLFAVSCVMFMFDVAQLRADDAWSKDYDHQSDLTITHVEIRLADQAPEDVVGSRTTNNFLKHAFTNDPAGPPPPVASYSFTGGDTATVNHVVEVEADAGPFPLPVSVALLWQSCGNGVIFPPLPAILGTSLDGMTLAVTLPASGSWYITAGVSGFSSGDYDWMALARYDGMTPIPVPPAPDTDGFGGMTAPPWDLFGINPPGCCLSWERPWCFSVAP